MPSRREASRIKEEQARERRAEDERLRAASQKRTRRVIGAAVAVVLVAAIAVVVVLLVGGDDETELPVAAAPVTTPVPEPTGADLVSEEFDGIPQDGSMLGDPKARYTLVEFGDLVCPPCATYATDILPRLVQDYVREGKLRIQFQPINLTRDSSALAGQYAWAAAAQDKLWDFVTLWYRNQGDENSDYVNDEFARAIAAKIDGLDADKLIADAHMPETRRKLDDFARRFVGYGLTVAPSFVAGRPGGRMLAIDLGETEATALRAVDLLVLTGGG